MSKCYVENNQKINKGAKMIKYTNGKYMKAPYDLVVKQVKVPNKDEQCTNNHYIEVSAISSMQVELNVDETKISDIYIGQKATVTISALEDKVLNGYVTKISSTASNGQFTVVVEFENDDQVMIGMTANVEI